MPMPMHVLLDDREDLGIDRGDRLVDRGEVPDAGRWLHHHVDGGVHEREIFLRTSDRSWGSLCFRCR